jgi:serine/threonine protein kinase
LNQTNLDFCEGDDLLAHVENQLNKKEPRLQEHDVIAYLFQLLNGFKILRWYKIMHRDMKPENVLKQYKNPNSNHIQICDFGLLKFGVEEANTAAGTKYYIAPEICEIYVKDEEKHEKKIAVKRKDSIEVEGMLLSGTGLGPARSPTNESVMLEYDSKVDIFGIACVIYESMFLARLLKMKKEDHPILQLESCYQRTGKGIHVPANTKISGQF